MGVHPVHPGILQLHGRTGKCVRREAAKRTNVFDAISLLTAQAILQRKLPNLNPYTDTYLLYTCHYCTTTSCLLHLPLARTLQKALRSTSSVSARHGRFMQRSEDSKAAAGRLAK